MSTRPRRWAAVVATLLVAATGALLWPVAPAHSGSAQSWSLQFWSSPCAGDSGVTVVVDFQQLGGGAQAGCDPAGGGRVAAAVFPAVGFPLTDVQQTPGFTCRVSGKPASDPCVRTPPATAYWSLWWSDGRSGTWSYATVGVNSLQVPDGGYVAFSWQGQAGRALPGISPTPRRTAQPVPPPSDTPSPDKSPEKSPDKSPVRPPKNDPSGEQDDAQQEPEVAPSSAAPEPKQEEVEATPSPESSAEASGAPDPVPTDAASPDATASERVAPREEPGRLPGWLSGALILGVAGAATAAWWWRRPASGGA